MDLFESRLGWTQRMPVENKSTQLKLLSYTETISRNQSTPLRKLRTFSVLAILSEILYNNSFNTGVLQWVVCQTLVFV